MLLTSNSSICGAVAIQNVSCPVWDRQEDLKFGKYYFTMTKQAAVIVKKSEFPNGFFLIMMVLSNDIACSADFLDYNPERNKIIDVIAVPKESYVGDLVLGVASGIAFCLIVYVIVFVRLYFENKKNKDLLQRLGSPISESVSTSRKSRPRSSRRRIPPPRRYGISQDISAHQSGNNANCHDLSHTPTVNIVGASSSGVCTNLANLGENSAGAISRIMALPSSGHQEVSVDDRALLLSSSDLDGSDSQDEEEEPYDEASSAAPGFDDTSCGGDNRSRTSRINDSWAAYGIAPSLVQRIPEQQEERSKVGEDDSDDYGAREHCKLPSHISASNKTGPLTLQDMTRKRSKMMERRSFRYLKVLSSSFIMYGVPALQLVVAYKNTQDVTGNLDTCYFNFRCMIPVGFVSDFSHLISNLGYALFGILFGIITFFKSRNYQQQLERESHVQNLGITRDYGLDYSLAASLIMEGVLSACYHVCPNRNNFQFDTTFMYIIALMLMLKLYQRRHPDIAANADTVFCFMALIVLFGVLGSFFNATWFWVVTSFAHCFLCLAVSCKIYYVGQWSFNSIVKKAKKTFHQARNGHISNFPAWLVACARNVPKLKVRKDQFTTRLSLLIVANIGNWCFLLGGGICRPSDYDTYLLGIFLFNLIIYVVFYICMKVSS